ncbi:hypothetical protein ACXET9_02645 [Brachybacterium sp. DNPG3]
MDPVTAAAAPRRRARIAAAVARLSVALLAVALLAAAIPGCGMRAQALGVEEAHEQYAGIAEELRETLAERFDDVRSADDGLIAYAVTADGGCAWHPGSITVMNDGSAGLRDAVGEAVGPVLAARGFGDLEETAQASTEPHLAAADEHGAEITVTEFGDVIVGLSIPVDTEGRACDDAALA